MANNITNMKFDVGVVRDPASDINALPVIADISVPVTALDTALNDNTRTLRRRANTYAASRTRAQLGVGIPYNAHNGTISG
jgi:uncharacterized protein (UPF0303 family)